MSGPPELALVVRGPADLSPREAEIVSLIAQGLSNQDIADRIFLSINSVKTYIRTAYGRMGVTSRSQALLWAIAHGYGPEGLTRSGPDESL